MVSRSTLSDSPTACTLTYNPDFTIGRKFDLDKAKQLIAEAGGGFKTTIIVYPAAKEHCLLRYRKTLGK